MVDQTVTSARRAQRRRLAALASAWLATIGGFTCSTPASGAPAEDAGEAVVVAGAGSTRRLDKGGSATEFSIRLPAGASCPGDSANDGYRVQSYVVPTTTTPAMIEYDGLGPAPNAYGNWETFRQPLYETSTRPFDAAQTADAAVAGQAGPIVDIPSFSFAVFRPGELPPGRYHLGIACTLRNQPVRYWNTEVVLAREPDDKPAEIAWRLVNSTEPATDSNELAGVAVIAGFFVVTVGVYASRRLRPRSPVILTEV